MKNCRTFPVWQRIGGVESMRNNQLIVLDGKSSKSSERPPKIAVLQHGCGDMSFCNHSKQEALLPWNAAAVGTN